MSKYKWVLTDADINQYGRLITNTIYEFKENGKEPTIIDITEYEAKEIEHSINSFGYTNITNPNLKKKSLSNIKELYGDKVNWIIAECLFETTI